MRVRGRETEKEFRLDKKSKSYSGAQIKKMTMSSQHSQKTQVRRESWRGEREGGGEGGFVEEGR